MKREITAAKLHKESIAGLRQEVLAMHLEQSHGSSSPYQIEKWMYPELANKDNFGSRRPKNIDGYLKTDRVPNDNSMRKLEIFCPGVSYVFSHPIYLLLGDARLLSDQALDEVVRALRAESYEYRADPKLCSSEYLRVRCSLRKLTLALYKLRRQQLSANTWLIGEAESKVVVCWLRVSSHFSKPLRLEISEILENGPLKLGVSRLYPSEAENRFRRQFGWFFNPNDDRRRAVRRLQYEDDVSTNDIKLFGFTGNLKFLEGRLLIDKPTINFGFKVGVAVCVFFALLIACIFAFVTPIPDGDNAEAASRIVSTVMLVILASIGHMGLIQPKIRLYRLEKTLLYCD